MTPEQWCRAKGLFHDALEHPDVQRGAFVASADAEPEVIVEVKRLLDQHIAAHTFLETPAAAVDPELMLSRMNGGDASIGPAEAPRLIGPYRILGVVGEGGMGVVYLAEQDNPRRTVALKVIRPGLATDALLRRFEHEAQALGRLQHPGIAQIHHAGMEGSGPERRPYFAMELVKGEPLLAFAESRGLGSADRVALFIKVCDAVQHAHIKGVIHRDLKPANIVVGEDGQPKVLDFGVARLADSDLRAATIQTNPEQIVGTVPYMSPEQIAGDAGELDTRSDVYSLGVVLYELLAGRLPYDLERKSIVEAARLIREQAPTRLSTVSRGLRGDLDVIVGKALEKEKSRRYQSAAELSADLSRYLRHEPISARAASATYQLRKFASRHRALVGALAVVLVVLIAALAGVLSQRNVARRHDARATALNDFFMKLLAGANPEQRHGREMTVKELLDVAAAKLSAEPSGDPEVDEEVRLTLGSTYQLLGALDKAEPLLRETLDHAEATLGPDHDITLEALTLLALNLTDRGMTDQAGPLLRRVYETRIRIHGERHPETLSAINNWSRWLDANGRQDEAWTLMERAVRIRTETLGADSRKTLISVDNLGKIMQNHGRLEDAETYMRRANEGFRRTLGEDDPDTFASYQNLAELMRKLKRYAEAEEFARLAAEGRIRVLGMDDRFTLYSINTRGRILMDEMRAADAEPYLKQSVEGIRRVSQTGETFAAGWGAIYARCLTALSRFEEAEGVLRDCEANLAAAAGDPAPIRKSVSEAYITLYTAWERPEEAAAWKVKLAPAK